LYQAVYFCFKSVFQIISEEKEDLINNSMWGRDEIAQREREGTREKAEIFLG